MPRLISPALRARVLALPGFTAKPTCPQCREPADPAGFSGRGICAACEVVIQGLERQADHERLDALTAAIANLERATPGPGVDATIRELEGERIALYYDLYRHERSTTGGE